MVACDDRAPISATSGGATEPLVAMQEPSWQGGRRCVFRDWCCSELHPELRRSTAVPRLALEHLASMPAPVLSGRPPMGPLQFAEDRIGRPDFATAHRGEPRPDRLGGHEPLGEADQH
jgi:hypothetical protein